ncbi:MBL fold metallo-hydrolase [Patulibacter americanus]|uniref:MBL fold metallo-hydrolase n=1 Tax=Patulibacter americanus TaxID=588672 RepID=UPI0003B5F4EC|nr:MBL fold metallo-hydrolase [Patulibacter americanus]
MSNSAPSPAGIVRVSLWGAVNAYLVPEDDGLTLVDTTMKAGAARLVAASEQLGQPIRRVVLTHAHDDHVGGLDALVERLGDVEVLISTRDARLLAGDRTLDPDEPQSKLRGGLHGAKTAPTRTLEHGDRVGSLRAVAAPGHTPGQLAFLGERDGTLLCGDAYATMFTVATCARAAKRFPLPGLATWHKPTALESARALLALAPERLAPGHGPVVEGPVAAMEHAVARGC